MNKRTYMISLDVEEWNALRYIVEHFDIYSIPMGNDHYPGVEERVDWVRKRIIHKHEIIKKIESNRVED